MMSVLMLVIVGAAAGFIATRALSLDLGLVPTIAIGVLGALVGGMILRFAIAAMSLLAGFVGAVIGAVVLILAWQYFFGRRV